ncbi:MAG: hypothetical protein QOF30_82 [Acidimicrobiaceae bacterium]|nr:hypothetical protein [Acidimicrobiaceae bacterium]
MTQATPQGTGQARWDPRAASGQNPVAFSAEELTAALNAVSDAITVQGPDGSLILANDAAAELLGFSSPAALLAVTPTDIMARFEVLDANGRPLAAGSLPGRAALAGGDPPEMLVRFRLRSTGAERFSLVKAAPVRDEIGRVVFAVNVFRDVTDRQVAIEELRASEARLAFLASAGRRLLVTSLKPRRVLQEVADLVVPELADWCAVREFSDDGRVLRVAVGPPELVGSEILGRLDGYGDPLTASGALAALTAGHSILVSDVTAALLEQVAVDDDHLELLGRLGVASVMLVPLASRGRVIGVLTLAAGKNRPPYRPADLELAEEFANRVAATVDNARSYAAEHATAETLARALLPGRLPDIPGLELAARYRAAGQVGGDFYDCFPLGDGTWLLAVGDVCGRGIAAAAMTGLTRHTIRALALHATSPAAVLHDLNRLILAAGDEQTARRPSNDRDGDPSFCTVCLAAVTPTPTGAQVVISVAGHPLPVLVRADAEVIEVGRPGSLLGVMADIDVSDEACELGPGDALVLFTDGITERRGGKELFGETTLGTTLRSVARAPAIQLARQVEDAAVAYATTPPDDDMAVLAVVVPETSVARPHRDATSIASNS